MDWMKFYFDEKILKKLVNIMYDDNLEQFYKPEPKIENELLLFYYSYQVKVNVASSIYTFKNKTQFLSIPSLIEFIKLEKTKPVKLHYQFNELEREILPNFHDYYKQINFETTITYYKFLDQLETILRKKTIIDLEPLPRLEDIFQKNDLDRIVSMLKEKCFATEIENQLTWTGIKHDSAKGVGYQLVALSQVCEKYYKRKNYQAKELHHAWTTYFHFDIKETNFKPSTPISDSYKRLFNFI